MRKARSYAKCWRDDKTGGIVAASATKGETRSVASLDAFTGERRRMEESKLNQTRSLSSDLPPSTHSLTHFG